MVVSIARPMKVENQSIKLIKPSNPTPPTLSRYKLGFIDEFLFAVDVGVVLSFSANNPNLVARLEKSLEETLTRFYPLAGRYVEEIQTIDCSDQGASFIHVNANIKLEELLFSEVNKYIDDLFPSKVEVGDSLLAIQVTTFECGGVALAISGLHKILDASTLCIFINEWAAISREENSEIEFTGHGFNSSLLFPARGLTSLPVQPVTDGMLSKYTRKKLVFTQTVISNMKAKGNKSTRRWSKVQLVSAIIWRALMKANLTDPERESALIQPVNLRGRMGSLIPKDSCGNVLGLCVTKCKTLETTEVLVDRLTDSIKTTISNFARAHHDSEEGQAIVLNSLSNMTNLPSSTHVVIISSWCRFPFHEIDFGFGKPIWVAPWTTPRNHVTVLMDDAEGNGVEAYVCVHEKYVPYFEEALELVNAFVV
ncbi:hypothetical protein SSX86_010268 [Deinandra increscens subsp. villosa]|uniref:Uncharacterized protein n=1 Tax=Deinandra increscens subsp. villosa TaxID=3103831 RepID=A0AAP0DC93_9ASTR